jgi:23S rRNA (guanosine2251-2'-O)-methyltransferase
MGRHLVLLALDCLTDPHNVGALLRTALVSGVDGVLLPRRNSCGPTPTVSKISAGALEHSAVVPVTNLVRTLDQLKANNFWVFGLDREGRQPLYAADFDVPLVLVIGGEGKGLRPLVKTHCDYLTCIPQMGPLDSLNASVAGAVALYEILRQRRAKGSP